MRKTGMLRGDRIAAWTAVFIVHVLIAWTLMRPPALQHDAAATDSALDLVWIATPKRLAPKSQPRAHAIAAVRSKPASPPPASDVRVSPAPRQGREAAAVPQLSAIFIHQAIEQAVREAPGTYQTDPLAHRAARLPGRAANTFRMRPPPSLAKRVAMVGKLFGGGDDPCRSARESINELSQAGDSRDLQNALDYEKRFCR